MSISVVLLFMCADDRHKVHDSSDDQPFCRTNASIQHFCQAHCANSGDANDGLADGSPSSPMAAALQAVHLSNRTM